ncbi:MAG: hypothetical protein ABR585_13070 [Gemmatimonadaceae bacterium]
MLEALPTNFFSTTFRLQQQGKLFGELESSILTERGVAELEDGTYELYREGLFSGDYVLEKSGKAVARATKPSALQNRFELELPTGRFVLRRLSILNRRYGLFDGETQIGTIFPQGLFTRRASIDLPSAWPLATRMFVFWLVFLMWRRQNAAAS